MTFKEIKEKYPGTDYFISDLSKHIVAIQNGKKCVGISLYSMGDTISFNSDLDIFNDDEKSISDHAKLCSSIRSMK